MIAAQKPIKVSEINRSIVIKRIRHSTNFLIRVWIGAMLSEKWSACVNIPFYLCSGSPNKLVVNSTLPGLLYGWLNPGHAAQLYFHILFVPLQNTRLTCSSISQLSFVAFESLQ